MKYMLLIYGNAELWESLPPEDLERLVADTDALHQELTAALPLGPVAEQRLPSLEPRVARRHPQARHELPFQRPDGLG